MTKIKEVLKQGKSAVDKLCLAVSKAINVKVAAVGAVIAASLLPMYAEQSNLTIANYGSNVVNNVRVLLYDKGLPILAVALGVTFLSMLGASKVDDIVARLKIAGGIILAGVGIYIFYKDSNTVVDTVNQLTEYAEGG